MCEDTRRLLDHLYSSLRATQLHNAAALKVRSHAAFLHCLCFYLPHPIPAGGLTFNSGIPSTPTFGDVWQIDAGVCLFAPNGKVCSGNGSPDLDTITCTCDVNHRGDAMCGSCTPNTTYGAACTTCPTSTDNAPCNSAQGGGRCDPVLGCVCNAGYTGTACMECAMNFWGPKCTACATCSAVGGSCDGNGTRSGTGTCVCKNGYTGVTCSTPPPQPPNNDNGNNAGVAAGLSVTFLGLAAVGSFFAYRRFGSVGGAVVGVTDLATSGLKSLYSRASGYKPMRFLVSSSTAESAGLIGGTAAKAPMYSAAAKLSPDKAASRFSSLTSGSSSPSTGFSGTGGYNSVGGSYSSA